MEKGRPPGRLRYSWEARCRLVVLMLSGVARGEAAVVCGASRATAYRLLRRYQEGGWDALPDRPPVARRCPHRLSAEAEARHSNYRGSAHDRLMTPACARAGALDGRVRSCEHPPPPEVTRMYATIRIYNQPELADDLAAHAEEIQRLMSGVEGLRSYVLFRTDAGCASVSVCDSAAAAAATTDTAAAWFRERTGQVTEPEPRIAGGEVLAAVNLAAADV